MPKADSDFKGFRIASLESRRAADMHRLIQRIGGDPYVSPSMREVPIEPNRKAIDFAYRMMTGHVSIVILMTGVGFRYLIKAIERHMDQQRFLDSLSDVITICRGPKPAAAMKEYGLTPTHRVPEPNTWRELLQTIDAQVPISNQIVGLQEYGITNASLIAGLEARGAIVELLILDAHAGEEQYRRAAGQVDRGFMVFVDSWANLNLIAPEASDRPWIHLGQLPETAPARVAATRLAQAWRNADADGVLSDSGGGACAPLALACALRRRAGRSRSPGWCCR